MHIFLHEFAFQLKDPGENVQYCNVIAECPAIVHHFIFLLLFLTSSTCTTGNLMMSFSVLHELFVDLNVQSRYI